METEHDEPETIDLDPVGLEFAVTEGLVVEPLVLDFPPLQVIEDAVPP